MIMCSAFAVGSKWVRGAGGANGVMLSQGGAEAQVAAHTLLVQAMVGEKNTSCII